MCRAITRGWATVGHPEDTLIFALTQVAAAFKSWLVVAPQWRDFLPAWLLGTLAAGTVLLCLLRAPIARNCELRGLVARRRGRFACTAVDLCTNINSLGSYCWPFVDSRFDAYRDFRRDHCR